MQPKKLALIHDMCGIGHCSMTVALPIVSVMGIQACPIPTAIFSSHTAYKNWHKVDFTDHIPSYLEAWDKENVYLDGIYCGYLGSGEQVNAVLNLVKKHPDSLFFLDPVMGDHGVLYSAITAEHISAMKTLVSHADYIVPNITEACVLTDTTYKADFSTQELEEIVQKLHLLGPKNVVITGIRDEKTFCNVVSSTENTHNHATSATPNTPVLEYIKVPVAGNARPGTGDIFASVLVSGILKGQPFESSVQKAAHFVAKCIQLSDEKCLPIVEGTCFELVLPTLLQE